MLWKMKTASCLFYCLFIPTGEGFFSSSIVIFSPKPLPELQMKSGLFIYFFVKSTISFQCFHSLRVCAFNWEQRWRTRGWIKNGNNGTPDLITQQVGEGRFRFPLLSLACFQTFTAHPTMSPRSPRIHASLLLHSLSLHSSPTLLRLLCKFVILNLRQIMFSPERGSSDIWYARPLLIAWSGGKRELKWTWNEHHASTHCAYNTPLNPTFFSAMEFNWSIMSVWKYHLGGILPFYSAAWPFFPQAEARGWAGISHNQPKEQ